MRRPADRAKAAEVDWPPDGVAAFLAGQPAPGDEGSDLLAGLARKMATAYKKAVHAPLIAEHLDMRFVGQLRPVIMPRLDPGAEATDHSAG